MEMEDRKEIYFGNVDIRVYVYACIHYGRTNIYNNTICFMINRMVFGCFIVPIFTISAQMVWAEPGWTDEYIFVYLE